MNEKTNPMTETYISSILTKKVPYQLNILNCIIEITDTSVYPPGKLTTMFANYLLQHENIKNKIIADVGAGSFALGILMAKHGAAIVLGIDISEPAVACAQKNIALNNVHDNAYIMLGHGIQPLQQSYQHKIDYVLSGAPWDSISEQNFANIPENRKLLSRAFYDVEDQLIVTIFTQGFDVLAQGGKIFITACDRIIPRIKRLCQEHHVTYDIVAKEDLHSDGNIHYILKIEKLLLK